MARCTTVVRSPNSAAEVFAYLADWSNLADWHPSVVESRQMTSGPCARRGARFHIVTGTGQRKVDRTFEVIDVIEHRALVARTQDRGMVITDSVSITPKSYGSIVSHRMHVSLTGFALLGEPIVAARLRRTATQINERLGALLAL